MHGLYPDRIGAGNVSGSLVDRDWGTNLFRTGLARDESADAIEASWDAPLRTFEAERAKYLLY